MNVGQPVKLLLGALGLLLLQPMAGAGLILTTTAGDVPPDSFFDVFVSVDTEGHGFYGYDIHLSADSSGVFALTDRTVAEPVNDALPPGLPSLGSPDFLDTESAIYGASVPLGDDPVSADNNLFLTTFTVHVLPSAIAGTYEISLTNWALYWDDAAPAAGVTGPGIEITVTPVPEPGSLALLLMLVPSGLLLRRRRRNG